MTKEENFRSRSQSVRQAARAHMLEIRRARTSKHAAAARPGVALIRAPGAGVQDAPAEVSDDVLLSADPRVGPDEELAEAAHQAGQVASIGQSGRVEDIGADDNGADDLGTDDFATDVGAPVQFGSAEAEPTGDSADTPYDRLPPSDALELAAVASAALGAPAPAPGPVPEPALASAAPAEKRKPARKSAVSAGPDGTTAVRKTAPKKPKPAPTAKTLPVVEAPEPEAAVAETFHAGASANQPIATMPELTMAELTMAEPTVQEQTVSELTIPEPTVQELAVPEPTARAPEQDVAADQLSAPAQDAVVLDNDAFVSPTAELPVAKPLPRDRGTLLDLPGAGPGLVWMLEQCGVATMQDMAQSDAAELSRKLGLVGQILNVQGWVDFARDHSSEQS